MIFTTPFGKKVGCDFDKSDNKGGIADFSIVLEKLSYLLCNTSLNHKFNKGGIKNGN